jgi:hypothetical protein
MRRGEILGLRWTDMDLVAARLSVRHAVVAVAYEVIESTPKRHNARVIDLNQETVAVLRAHRQQQLEERDEWGADYEEHDLVAAKENGSPIHPHSFSQSFERLVKNAGVRTIRLHDLRNTHATLALKAGVPVKVVSERLGHESPAFTLSSTRTSSPVCRPQQPQWLPNSSDTRASGTPRSHRSTLRGRSGASGPAPILQPRGGAAKRLSPCRRGREQDKVALVVSVAPHPPKCHPSEAGVRRKTNSELGNPTCLTFAGDG